MSFRSTILQLPLILFGLTVAVQPRVRAAEHTTDSLDKVQRSLADETAVLIDVREQDEWDAGHLQDATLVPLSSLPEQIDSGKIKQQLPSDKVIYCHCRSGGRVLRAADLLKAQGYDVRPLKTGYQGLLQAGFEPAPAE
ncbi:MAG: rhodanese-like domain-containing protein [Planctomycetaceae bacterium]|nr:rhodanese-like domain-containing protein [Planctomycetaceae bacterium]